jgi:rhodanese-related sulfurtransferase
MFKKTIVQLSIILLSSLFVGVAYDQFRSEGIGLTYSQNEASGVTVQTSLSAEEILSRSSRTLTLPEALVLFETKAAVFIDARPASFYQAEHIKNAISIYYKTAGLNPALDKLNKSNPYVVYCKGPNCNQAQLLIGTMQKAGFSHVFLFPGGIQEWRMAQYPVDRNSTEVKK